MDDELAAMQAAASALSGLDEPARGRVVRWLAERYGVSHRPASVTAANAPPENLEREGDFADFFSRIPTSTDKERALVAAYWLRRAGTQQFPSMEINSMLKDLGHRVSNITDALTAAMREKPALVIQIKKSGTSKQARKLYRLTDAGIKWVEGRMTEEGRG